MTVNHSTKAGTSGIDNNKPRLRVEQPAAGVTRIVLARPEKRNAQDPTLLYELDAAFAAAAADQDVRVIILAADGPDFSSGHDLTGGFKIPGPPTATLEGDFDNPGLEGHIAFESEVYLGLCRRWRELPKPTIAQVQGRVIAGGTMLIWPLDLIVAADTATFTEPTTAFGGNGHEYFVYPFELGVRKAKEFLFTGETFTAQQLAALGMVNWVVPEEELAATTLRIAERIASRPPFAIRMAKASVNRAQDAQGMQSAVDHAFGLHQLCQAVNIHTFGSLWDPAGPPPGLKLAPDPT